MASMKVPTLAALAEVMGIHRRTLADYKKAGCPTIKTRSGYLLAPTLQWYGRMLMRRQLRKHIELTPIPPVIEESLEQILDDHEKAWSVYLEKEYRP